MFHIMKFWPWKFEVPVHLYIPATSIYWLLESNQGIKLGSLLSICNKIMKCKGGLPSWNHYYYLGTPMNSMLNSCNIVKLCVHICLLSLLLVYTNDYFSNENKLIWRTRKQIFMHVCSFINISERNTVFLVRIWSIFW